VDRVLKNAAIYMLIVLLALFAIQLTSNRDEKVTELTYPQFYNKVQQEQVKIS
jgi:cell division protease FtsH